jgi:hypothetical protein
MVQRSCAVCGSPFDAVRPHAKYCGKTCGKRAQRAGLASSRGVARARFSNVAVSDPYVRLNVDLAGAVGVSLPAGLLSALASDDDDRTDSTQDEFAAVELHVTDRFLGAVRRGDSDGSDRLGRSLKFLMDDLVDARVVSYLAAALRGPGTNQPR